MGVAFVGAEIAIALLNAPMEVVDKVRAPENCVIDKINGSPLRAMPRACVPDPPWT